MKKLVRVLILGGCAFSLVMASGCGKEKNYNDGKTYYSYNSDKNKETTGKKRKITNTFDTKMSAVVKHNNTEIGLVILVDVNTSEEYTMTYASNLQIIDKYGKDRDISYLKTGDIVDAYYLKSAVQLTGVVYSDEVWEYKECDDWSIDTKKSTVTVCGKTYYFNPNEVFVLASGENIEFNELNSMDILSVRGVGKKVLSIALDRGHGYLKFEGIDKFIGGWVQIGKTIKPITENMLMIAPEGTYDVKIVKDGYGGALSTTVGRNEEVTMNFSDIAAKVVRYGTVEFIIVPDDVEAELKIAGQVTNYNKPVLLEYDNYSVVVTAEGYETYTGTLKVGQNLSQIVIKLTKKENNQSPSPSPSKSPGAATPSPTATPHKASSSDDDNSGNSSGNQSSTSSQEKTGYTISVTDPEGASVYFDDEYKGTVPLEFPKVSGSHTMTFSKDGYQTKSYTLDISNTDENVTYCMPALEQN